MTTTSHKLFTAGLVIATLTAASFATLAASTPANAMSFSGRSMPAMGARTTSGFRSIGVTNGASALRNPAFSSPSSIAAWTKVHTEAPSQFHAPVGGFAKVSAGQPQPPRTSLFNGAAAGPAGAQFGRLPNSNNSFVDPTRNSVQAHQTQNSVQAVNTQMSNNAVQGRNCSLNAIRAGLCQGR
jgi:hypothetical protein